MLRRNQDKTSAARVNGDHGEGAGHNRGGESLRPPTYGIDLADRGGSLEARSMPVSTIQPKCACGGTCAHCQGKSHEAPSVSPADPLDSAFRVPRVSPGNPALTLHRFRGMIDGISRARGAGGARESSEAWLAEAPVFGDPGQALGPGGEELQLTTGGYSMCNLGGAAPRIVNNNDEATRSCTQRHEEFHVSDWGPCCTTARAAYQADGADQGSVLAAWNAWMRANNSYHECRAYPVSITCANELWTSNSCGSDSPPDAEACSQIGSYRDHVTERRGHYCGLAGADARTDCPSFT